MLGPDDEEDEREEMRRYDLAQKRHQTELMQHPDCRDPDHPGCLNCDHNDEPPSQ